MALPLKEGNVMTFYDIFQEGIFRGPAAWLSLGQLRDGREKYARRRVWRPVDNPAFFINHTRMPTSKEDLARLTLLGRKVRPSKKLEVFPNHNQGRRYTVTLTTSEFTCLCPATGQPDFASITIRYIPDRWILESKSLKLYLWSYRGEGVFHEHVVNTICDDIVEVLDPHWIEVTGCFGARGGIGITVVAAHDKNPRRKPKT